MRKYFVPHVEIEPGQEDRDNAINNILDVLFDSPCLCDSPEDEGAGQCKLCGKAIT